MKQKIKKLLLAGLMSSTLLATVPAHAMIVHDPGSLAAAIKQWGVEAYQWAETKVQWAADALARREQTGAIIDANEAVGDKIIKANEQMTQAQADVLREQQLSDAINAAAIKNQTSMAACAELTINAIKRAGGAGGGGRVAGNIYTSRTAIANVEDADNKTLTQALKIPALCSELDKERNSVRKLNCSSEGLKAEANIKAGSIFAAAGTGTTAVFDKATGKPKDASLVQPSWTMNAEDIEIAKMHISNLTTSNPPTKLIPAAEATDAGKSYMSMLKNYESRMAHTTEAVAGIMSKSVPMVSDTAKKLWATQETVFKELWPGRDFKKSEPTVNERINLEVYKPMTTVWENQILALKGDQSKLLERLIERVNLNTEVQLMSLRQLESLTAVNAALLTQAIEPVKRSDMDALKIEAMKVSKR